MANKSMQWHAQNIKALPAEGQLPPEWIYLAGVEYFAGDAGAYWSELNRTMLERASKTPLRPKRPAN